MHNEISISYVTTDSGRVIEVVHVSPVYVRLGAPARGTFAGGRLARSRRTDARHTAGRSHPEPEVVPNVVRF